MQHAVTTSTIGIHHAAIASYSCINPARTFEKLLCCHKMILNCGGRKAQCLAKLGSAMEGFAITYWSERTSSRSLGMGDFLHPEWSASLRYQGIYGGCTSEYALEAIQWLAILGADRNAVMNAVQKGMLNKCSTLSLPIMELVSAHFLQHRNQTTSAISAFSKLEREFPNNIYLLL